MQFNILQCSSWIYGFVCKVTVSSLIYSILCRFTISSKTLQFEIWFQNIKCSLNCKSILFQVKIYRSGTYQMYSFSGEFKFEVYSTVYIVNLQFQVKPYSFYQVQLKLEFYSFNYKFTISSAYSDWYSFN